MKARDCTAVLKSSLTLLHRRYRALTVVARLLRVHELGVARAVAVAVHVQRQRVEHQQRVGRARHRRRAQWPRARVRQEQVHLVFRVHQRCGQRGGSAGGGTI